MSVRLTRRAFVGIVDGDIGALLRDMPRSLERDHIEAILRAAPGLYYPSSDGAKHEDRTNLLP